MCDTLKLLLYIAIYACFVSCDCSISVSQFLCKICMYALYPVYIATMSIMIILAFKALSSLFIPLATTVGICQYKHFAKVLYIYNLLVRVYITEQ